MSELLLLTTYKNVCLDLTSQSLMHVFMIGSIQNIKFEAFGSLQRGFYGIPYIGYFIAADVLHLGMSLVISYDGRHKLRMND